MANINELQRISTQLRRDIVRMVTNAKSGHPGGSMSSADFLTALYFEVMKHDPATWTRSGKDQDVFILSAGHLTPIYYSLLARTGYFPVSELATFRQFGSRLQGHPSIAKGLPGVFQPSGSLGQGLSLAAGIAIAKKMDGSPLKYGEDPSGDLHLHDDEFWAYGGDFGDAPNYGAFVMDGLIRADRVPNPHYYQLPYIYQNIAFRLSGKEDGKYRIALQNKHFFTGLDEFDYMYEWLCDGVGTGLKIAVLEGESLNIPPAPILCASSAIRSTWLLGNSDRSLKTLSLANDA